MQNVKINVLGTKHDVIFSTAAEEKDDFYKTKDGCCDCSTHTICVQDFTREKREPEELENIKKYVKRIARHEIIHAFLDESGLQHNSCDISGWARNEEMVDWIAIQFPKLQKAFRKCGCE